MNKIIFFEYVLGVSAEISVPVIATATVDGSRQEISVDGRRPARWRSSLMLRHLKLIKCMRTTHASCSLATSVQPALIAIHSTHPACGPSCSADAISSCHRSSPTVQPSI